MNVDAMSYVGELTNKLEGWIEGFVAMLPNMVAAIVVVAVFGLAARWVCRLVTRLLERATGNKPISGLLGVIARFATIAVGVFIALGMLQLDKTVTSLLAGVGVIGLALGFAFQDIAANFMSGIIMAMRRPFDVGDLVEVAGHKARVKHIMLRATELETLDGLTVLVPNKDIFQNAIINYTHTDKRRLDVAIGTAYSDDMEHVRAVTISALQNLEGRDPEREVEVFFDGFGDSSINATVRIWLDSAEERFYKSCRSEAMIAIKKAFDREGISIPFPIRTLDFGAQDVGGQQLRDNLTALYPAAE